MLHLADAQQTPAFLFAVGHSGSLQGRPAGICSPTVQIRRTRQGTDLWPFARINPPRADNATCQTPLDQVASLTRYLKEGPPAIQNVNPPRSPTLDNLTPSRRVPSCFSPGSPPISLAEAVQDSHFLEDGMEREDQS